MATIKDKLPQPAFSSPIICPDNKLGYYLHVPPFDHKQDQARLVIASIDKLDQETPKVYQVRPLQSVVEDSPSLFSPSINTSASTLEEMRLAERQMFRQTCPETFDTIESVYNPARNRRYHFNKLKQMMSYYENSNNSAMRDGDNSSTNMDHLQDRHGDRSEQQHSTNTFHSGALIDSPPRHSSKSHYYNAPQDLHCSPPNLKRYDSSKIVRYTLVDKELSHTRSTNSSYHQRLNQYDDDTRPASTNHQQLSGLHHTPPLPSYHPTLHPKLQTSSYYDYWTTSDSSNYSSSRDSKCSSQFYTTDSNYSTMYNQRNQQILKELGYSPNISFGIQNSEQSLDAKKKAEVTFHLRPSKLEEKHARTDNKQTKQLRVPYFTYLSTLVMIAYFAGCLIKNYQLTGAVIQLSPFNVMIGPSAEVSTIDHAAKEHSHHVFAPLPYTQSTTRYTHVLETQVKSKHDNHHLRLTTQAALGAATRPRFNDQHSAGIFVTDTLSYQNPCDLQSVCGGNSFNDPSTPDQGYRFISAIFMHSGIVQLVINMLVHIRLGMQVETKIHSGRYAVIWLVSGVFGYLFGSLFVPDGNVSMGCSVPLMGVMAFLCVDLIRHWHTITHPARVLLCIIIYFGELYFICHVQTSYNSFKVITLAIGLLPGYDNFSHFGGFIGGTLITLAVLPMSQSCVDSKRDKQPDQSMLIWLMRILMLAFIAVLMWILVYLLVNKREQESCHACRYFSCLPFSDLCSPYI
ncbi:rhomboid family membrane protein [Mucor ambiguus]|uniref:Rhomboid-type serine protease n=1 Tax=Mucor ambiguus TaxID=91626 RepID=A0A0C9MHF1_9FUNG|nr:rhomboid family membrane protein [Mucor ambiguus]